MAKLALGKGLDALIPMRKTVEESSGYMMLDLNKISTLRTQPRKRFTDKSIDELADSIRENGLLQPLLVRRVNGSYELIAGERRLRAAQVVGIMQVPVIVKQDLTDHESFQLALIENIQREDLTPIEEAEAYMRLLEKGGMTKDQLASQLGKNRSTISNSMRLLSLPDEIKDMINDGAVSAGHARAILALDSEAEQIDVARRIAESELSVRALEEIVYGKPRKKRGRSLKLKRPPAEIYEAETSLKQHLQTAVRVKRSLKGGRLEIDFYSQDDLARLVDLILHHDGSMPRNTSH